MGQKARRSLDIFPAFFVALVRKLQWWALAAITVSAAKNPLAAALVPLLLL